MNITKKISKFINDSTVTSDVEKNPATASRLGPTKRIPTWEEWYEKHPAIIKWSNKWNKEKNKTMTPNLTRSLKKAYGIAYDDFVKTYGREPLRRK
ncbi:MAG: hypothetical protein ACOC56_00870 [Atribacterota bacterium]